MNYRPEIDGLRAVAVIPVILFHARIEAFSGGFVGVDIFFVISGYLITTIILTEKSKGTFSLVNFYERRARRILPALFTVMLVCLPFAWLWLRPVYLKDFSQSLVAVSVFASNFLFWQESGYFTAAVETKPLLHTWSLAVEEQYYLLFPLFLMLLWSFRKRWILGALIVVGVFSLVLAQWGSWHYPDATFYLLPTRAWELMVGASVAFIAAFRRPQIEIVVSNKAISEVSGWIGFILIAYSIFVFDETIPFPSVYALIPTLGVALIILFTTAQTVLGRLLGNRILVGVGLISYSAYLWHVPLFVFARQRNLTELATSHYLALSMMAIMLAYLSWRYVEKPFRQKNVVSRRMIFSFAAIGSMLFVVIGLAGHITNGFENRRSNDGTRISEIEEKLKTNHGLSGACRKNFTLSPACRTSDAPEILVWGDSYAMHLLQGIQSSNPAAKIIQMTKSECGPFFGVAPIHNNKPMPWVKECLEFTRRVHKWLQSSESVKYAVLSSPFSQYLSDSPTLLVGDALLKTSTDLVLQQFLATLESLERMGISPIVFSPLPANGNNIGDCLANAAFLEVNLDICNFPVEEIEQKRKVAYAFLKQVEKKYPVVWFNEYLCQDGMCSSHLESTYIYRDAGHFSHEGSAALGEHMDFYGLITSSIDINGAYQVNFR